MASSLPAPAGGEKKRPNAAGILMLAREPSEARPRIFDERLELGVGVFPEIHEPAVGVERLLAITALLMQLAEALVAWTKRQGPIGPQLPDNHERGGEPLVCRDEPLVVDQRRVRVPQSVVGLRQRYQARKRTGRLLTEPSQRPNGIRQSALGAGDRTSHAVAARGPPPQHPPHFVLVLGHRAAGQINPTGPGLQLPEPEVRARRWGAGGERVAS